VEVEELARSDGAGWRLRTRDGGELEADVVVVATGFSHDRFTPDVPGRETFTGEHACRPPRPFEPSDEYLAGRGGVRCYAASGPEPSRPRCGEAWQSGGAWPADPPP